MPIPAERHSGEPDTPPVATAVKNEAGHKGTCFFPTAHAQPQVPAWDAVEEKRLECLRGLRGKKSTPKAGGASFRGTSDEGVAGASVCQKQAISPLKGARG